MSKERVQATHLRDEGRLDALVMSSLLVGERDAGTASDSLTLLSVDNINDLLLVVAVRVID